MYVRLPTAKLLILLLLVTPQKAMWSGASDKCALECQIYRRRLAENRADGIPGVCEAGNAGKPGSDEALARQGRGADGVPLLFWEGLSKIGAIWLAGCFGA
jgi:hypothetical protein